MMAPFVSSAVTAVPAVISALLQSDEGMAPLPAQPPIGGVVWTVVIPTILLVGSFLATFLLYRRFAREGGAD